MFLMYALMSRELRLLNFLSNVTWIPVVIDVFLLGDVDICTVSLETFLIGVEDTFRARILY